jgi:hypothetical protein
LDISKQKCRLHRLLRKNCYKLAPFPGLPKVAPAMIPTGGPGCGITCIHHIMPVSTGMSNALWLGFGAV